MVGGADLIENKEGSIDSKGFRGLDSVGLDTKSFYFVRKYLTARQDNERMPTEFVTT